VRADCVRGIATGDTRVRGEFDLVDSRSLRADELLTAFVELKRAILSTTPATRILILIRMTSSVEALKPKSLALPRHSSYFVAAILLNQGSVNPEL